MLLLGKPNVKKMKERKDIEGLIKALDYGKWHKKPRELKVNEAAAEALAQIGDIRTVNRLIQSEFYTRGTELALVRIGVPAVEPLIAALESRKDKRDVIIRILANIGDYRAADVLISALKDVSRYTREWATDGLVRIGAPAVEPLIEALESRKDNRDDIIEILAKIGDPRAADVLISALKDVSKYKREWVTDALVRIGDPRAVDVLFQALIDEDEYSREYATKVLVGIGNPVVESLIAALSDERGSMREAAENVLRKIRTPEASEALSSFFRRKEEMEKKRRIEDGDELPDGEYYERIEKLIYDDQRKKLTQELIKIGRPVIPSLITAIRYFKHWVTKSEKIHKEDPASEHYEWQVEAEKNALDSVVTILKEITGKDFGYSSQSWKKWWQQENKKE
jgi:HEAT repeat protein